VGFPELLVQIASIIGMTPVEMHLEPFGNQLEFVSKSFGQNTGVTFGIGNFNSKGFSCSADDLLNLRERFLIHTVSPYEVTKFMALAEGSQTALPFPGWSFLPGSAPSTSKYCYSKNQAGLRKYGGSRSTRPPFMLAQRAASEMLRSRQTGRTERSVNAPGWIAQFEKVECSRSFLFETLNVFEVLISLCFRRGHSLLLQPNERHHRR
jgi:hypothetical protein